MLHKQELSLEHVAGGRASGRLAVPGEEAAVSSQASERASEASGGRRVSSDAAAALISGK